MKSFKLVKGNKSVMFYDNGTVVINKITLVGIDQKETYRRLLNEGYTLVKETERKAASPKANKILYCPEGRKIWAKEFSRRKSILLSSIESLKGDEWRKARIEGETLIRSDMKTWEAENASSINQWLIDNGFYKVGV